MIKIYIHISQLIILFSSLCKSYIHFFVPLSNFTFFDLGLYLGPNDFRLPVEFPWNKSTTKANCQNEKSTRFRFITFQLLNINIPLSGSSPTSSL